MKRFILFASLLALSAHLYGCGDDCRSGGRSCGDDDDDDNIDAQIPDRCTMSSQCNDGVACTTDSCSPAGTCRFDLVNESCPTGELCTATGCAAPPECTEDAMCDDNKECTSDRCTIEGCVNERVDARCATAGFGSVCNPDGAGANATTGCTPATGCANAAQCDDDTACTTDTCVDNRCVNTAGSCPDGETCIPGTGCQMIRTCDPSSPTADEDCDDDDFCNGAEVCVAEFGCMNTGNPVMCRDDQACTRDECNRTMNMCTYTCDETISGCTCDGPAMCDPEFSGRFNLSPSPTYACAEGEVNYNLANARLICSSGMLSVVIDGLPSPGRNATLTQMGMPAAGSFDAKFAVAGDCPEEYRLQGTFTDADHFNGTFSFTFMDPTGLCGLVSDCSTQTTSVTGTRAE